MKNIYQQRFGRLVAIKRIGKTKYGNYTWMCRCDCGKEIVVPSGHLISGHTKSCGCYALDIKSNELKKHGITAGGKPRIFTIWNDMKSRCLYKNDINYNNYGARGIKVCNEWLEFETFYYWAMCNGYKDELQIDRINNNGNYEPMNCHFVTRHENMRNMRSNHYVVLKGTKKIITDWINELGLVRSTV